MAHDVTQQVFLKLFTTIDQFRQDSEFATWLYRIVANACVDEQRKRRRFVRFRPEVEVKDSGRDLERTYHRREIADSVRGAIAELTRSFGCRFCSSTSRACRTMKSPRRSAARSHRLVGDLIEATRCWQPNWPICAQQGNEDVQQARHQKAFGILSRRAAGRRDARRRRNLLVCERCRREYDEIMACNWRSSCRLSKRPRRCGARSTLFWMREVAQAASNRSPRARGSGFPHSHLPRPARWCS